MSDFDGQIDPFYCYDAHVVSVYDGDTITCDVKLGFNVTISNQKIRLYGIDTPELRGDERDDGIISRDFVRDKILDKDIKLYTLKDKRGKYGRMLGIVYVENENINQLLLDKNLAVEYII